MKSKLLTFEELGERLERAFGLPIEDRFFFPIECDLLDPEKYQPNKEGCSVAIGNNSVSDMCADRECADCICSRRNFKHLKVYIESKGGQRKPVEAKEWTTLWEENGMRLQQVVGE